ncbi:helix-turn-helix domain-containing protein [Phenylobacterium sp.]|uniref:helix-turn-helix domain-containing protein n=1 Tax=Phenylobacterium sp. TaxID=1871053 RepID=UPI00374D9614
MTNDIDTHLGERLRTRRLSQGLSQRKLGALVGLSCQQIHRYETAAQRVPARLIWFFSQALEVSAPYFFEDFSSKSTIN